MNQVAGSKKRIFGLCGTRLAPSQFLMPTQQIDIFGFSTVHGGRRRDLVIVWPSCRRFDDADGRFMTPRSDFGDKASGGR